MRTQEETTSQEQQPPKAATEQAPPNPQESQQESPPSSPPSKENLKDKVKRLQKGEEKKAEPEEPPASKKSIERLEEKISETEKKNQEYLKKLDKLETIDKTVNEALKLENARKNAAQIKSIIETFDSKYPAPHPNDFESGADYEAAMNARKEAKDYLAEQWHANNMLLHPDKYSQPPTEPRKDPEFEAELAQMEKSVPGLTEVAKIVDAMPDWQQDMITALPPGTRSLVAHCFGRTFSQEQVAAMPREEFIKQYRLAVDFVQKQIAAASAAAQPPEDPVRAPPKMTEGAPPPERRESLKEKAARVNGSFYHR